MADRPRSAPTSPGHLGVAPTLPAPGATRDADVTGDASAAPADSLAPDHLGTARTLREDEVARARPALASLELDVAQARAEAALFGTAEAVKIGRYRIIERAGAGGMGVVWSAWDPELGRGVALKLASSGDTAARDRARDEGRALARLSHPNVVPIYDVLEHDDGVFLVMELVKGKTLRSAAAGQPPLQIIRAYRQAGEGLAAAHEAGLIHRDFKPDNAILGADGRVRVLDFGLAHDVAPPEDGSSPAIAGTPRYMAPEQRAGEQLTPAVDQYALCVALRETLTAAGGVPRWVAPILARGTASAPADRFPSMPALLAALALDPATRWRRRIAAGAAVLAVGGAIGGFTLGRARSAEATPCAGGPDLVAATWGPTRRAQIAGHLLTLETPFAARTVPDVLRTIDTYRDDWLALHKASCVAHRGGELSAELFDRRTVCLGQRRGTLAAIADQAAATAAERLPNLIEAVAQLPPVEGCADDEALIAGVKPPGPAQAAAAAAIDDTLAAAAVKRDAGELDAARQLADEAVTAAIALGYAPLVARAHLARGRVALSGMRDDRGAADFAATIHAALVVGDEPTAVEAFARRAWALGTRRDQPASVDPAAGLELIEAIVERLGARVAFASALLESNLGSVALARGDREAALGRFQRARALAGAVGGAGALELSVIDEGLLHVAAPADRATIARELVDKLTALVGPLHPRTLRARIVVANIADDTGDVAAELDDACAQVIRFHPSVGSTIGECGYEVLWAAVARADTSRAAIADAVIAARATGARNTPTMFASAYRLYARGDTAGAIAALRTQEDPAAPEWWNRMYAADALTAAAFIERSIGRAADARATATQAAAVYDSAAAAIPPSLLARRRRALETLTP